MKNRIFSVLLSVLALIALSGPLSAHHSVGVFDTSTPIWVKGTIVRFHWGNPHSAIILEQETEDGKKIRWALENSGRLDMLVDRGFTKNSFEPGDIIEACGYAPKKSRTPLLPITESDSSAPGWLAGADKVITGRFLLTKHGPVTDWSHYGPLEDCISQEKIEAFSH